MTLIVSPGEDVLSSSSDDGDSGCLAGSPDLKEDVRHVTHHDLFLASKLKRLSLQDVKALHVSSAGGEGGGGQEVEEVVIAHTIDLQSDSVSSKNLTNGDGKITLNGKDVDCDNKKGILDKHHQGLGDVNSSSNSSISSPRPVVIYECQVSANSTPGTCADVDYDDVETPKKHDWKLEGPAVASSPVIHLASQVHCNASDSRVNDCIPPAKQKSMLTMQLMASCNNSNNNCNDSSCSLASSDVTETLAPATRPPTSGKWSENGDGVGGYSERVAGAVEGDGAIDDVTAKAGTTRNDGDDCDKKSCGNNGDFFESKSPSIITLENHVHENALNTSCMTGSAKVVDRQQTHRHDGTTYQEVVMSHSVRNSYPSPEEVGSQLDIHRAKEKINLLRQNFLSSLSADDDDFDQPDFIVLPHHSDNPQGEEEEDWLQEEERRDDNGDDKKQTETKKEEEGRGGGGGGEEGGDNLDLERKGKCSVEVTEVMAGSECGRLSTNGGDFVQEAGEEKKKEEEEEESKEEEEELLVVPGAEVSSGTPALLHSGTLTPLHNVFYGDEHLDSRDPNTTAQDNDDILITSLDDVRPTNVLSAEEEEEEGEADDDDGRVSSIKLLVSEASARLLEHEISGRDDEATVMTADFVSSSSDITMCENSGNVIPVGVISPEKTPVGGEGDVDGDDIMPHSSFVVNLQSSPPTELPPSLPPSPPPPPSSPQSPGLFKGDVSGSPPNYLKAQSANFVNLMMLQSRKHKRLHRLRLPDSTAVGVPVAELQSGEGGEDGGGRGEKREVEERRARNDEECERRLQPPLQSSSSSSSSAQPPRQHGNPHVRGPSSSSSSTVVAAANAHCGTTDQLVLCSPGPLPPPPPLHHLHHPHSSTENVVGQSLSLAPHQPKQTRPLPSSVVRNEENNRQSVLVPMNPCPNNDNQRKAINSTSLLRKLKEERRLRKEDYIDAENESRSVGTSENDSVFDNESCCSDNSCLGYLNFDHESFVDSDNDYDIEQKNKLREACKDIARALNTLPSPLLPEGNEGNSFPRIVCGSEVMYHDTRPRYCDQQVEAHLSDTDDPLTVDRLSVQVRSCGTSTTSDDDRRNSFYDNNCGMNGGHCECGRCDTSDVEEINLRGRFPPPPPPPPGTPPPSLPPPPPQRAMDKRRRPRQVKGTTTKSTTAAPHPHYSCGVGGRDTSDYEDEGFRTDVGEGCRTDEFDVCTTSDDNDYDDDYCQTDDCGEECDYCSGDDAEDEDEAEDTCYFCKKSQNVTPVCKHPGVITNGILKSFNGRGREEKECSVRGVPHGRSLALQAAIHRRRITRQGLVAIRESSITSDELPESEEEVQSYDGSNCDISSSWRFGLCRDLTMSRDSTLRSVHSDRSSSSLPAAEHLLQRHKEKSNSLPGANSRSIAGDLSGRLTSAGGGGRGSGIGTPFRQVSTSDDESGSHSSLPRLPPRPPRAPRMRPPLTPSPPAGALLIAPPSPVSLRPAMGLQGLQQQRSPGTPRALHVSGLPVAPRTVAPRSPSNPNPPYGFPILVGSGPILLCPGSPSLAGRSTPSPGGGSEGPPPASPRISSRAGALVTRNFSISDDEGGGRWTGGRRHVTITRHESVYKEVAEKGYHLPPGSPVDPYWLTWKLGVLQKTVEEVSGRLEEAQKTADGWGPVSQDPNLADQHAHNVRKFREGLAELQRGVDDVNDQAARFSAHNVPLTPANSAKLHDLNNRWKSLETAVNDRWRQVACRSREVTPLTPAQLASSVSPPWERATTSNKVPYYINHDLESTHWDHPIMMDLLDSMNEFNHIKFSAYRTATKLRILQKKLALDLAKLQMATDIFDEHGLRGQNDRLIDVGDMVVVLSALYANISADHPEVNTTLAMDLCLNWLLNVYDSQRTGQMRVLSFKIGLVCLCCGHLEEKYRYMFRLIADPNRLVDQRKLGLLLHDCVQVPRQLGEVAAFGGSNIEPSVRSCFTKAGKDRETIEAVHFLTWVQQEPQSLVWLAVLHRVAASENIQHQVKCNICKAYPIVGLRYRCLKCLSFDMCQRCFFDGRSGKSHKITHPMHEYCTATTAGEDVKDFTKALKNKFKSKRSLQKHTKKGYLPVQTVLEGDPLESPSPSPQHNVTSQDMHSRLELYASRLAEVELRTNSNSTPDSEDEHGLIAQYCQSLSSSDAPLPVPRSPLQIMAAVDAEQKDELEQMIRALEEENSVLQAEYDRLKSQQPVGSPPDDGLAGQRSEADMLAEAKLLRQHKGRLEARMGILEEHNRQLEAQLHRLRQLLGEPGGVSSPNKSGTLQTKSVTASQLAMDSPAKVNGHSTQGGAASVYEGLEQMSDYVRPPPPPMGSVAHVGNLFSRAGDLGKAVGTLVATMTHEGASDLPSDEEEEEDSNASDTEEEKAV